jgi:anhydro-N-acetylmuramic acid kinase
MKQKGRVMHVAGMMSGTSLDGVDLAVIETDGRMIFGIGETRYRPYTQPERDALRLALGAWPGDGAVARAAHIVEQAHIAIAQGVKADLIGFHGQTLAHDPAGGRTHQAGDGGRLAQALGRPVAWDFRTHDVQSGGQGAPLAPFYHWAAARYVGATAPVAVLNLGGVGNITWVDPTCPAPDAPGALVAFDTGPANAPMDDIMAMRGLGAYDKDGALAAAGIVDQAIVDQFLSTPFFQTPPPKSLDRLDFAQLLDDVAALNTADALATLAQSVAVSVGQGMMHLPARPSALWVTGGGRQNATVMQAMADVLDMPVIPIEQAGLDGDFLEAQAFAYLAARVAHRHTISAPMTTGTPYPMTGGRLSTPD